MSDFALTFGLVDQVTIGAPHIVSAQAGVPLAPMPEDPAPAWASGAAIGTYPVGTLVHRPTSHLVYERVAAHGAVETTPPEQAPTLWKAMRPTNLYAPFDMYRYTTLQVSGALRLELRPGAPVDTIYLAGLTAVISTVTVTAGPGGPQVAHLPGTTWAQGRVDWQSFFLAPAMLEDSLLMLLDYPVGDPVIVIELDGADGQVELGNLVLGRRIMFGATESGADISPVSYSDWEEAADGTVRITRRPGAGDINVSGVAVPKDSANAVVALLKKYDARPTLWLASPRSSPWLSPLREYGIFSGPKLNYPHSAFCRLSGRIKGMV